MDFELLTAFIEVVEAGSMAETAITLDCTAPAVSQKMKRLERDFGTPLLERTPYGVRPTPAGSALLERARHLLGITLDIRSAVVEAAGAPDRQLRMSAFSSASVNLLPDAVATVKRKFPDVALSLVEIDYEDPLLAVVRGDVDLCVGTEFDHVPQDIPRGVDVATLGRDPLRVLMPISHPLAAQRKVRFEELRDEDWVFYPPKNVARVSVEVEAASFDFQPTVIFRTRDYQVIHVLVGAGLGVATLPSMMVPEFDKTNIAVRKLHGSELGRTVYLAHRTGVKSAPLLAMKAALAEVFEVRVAAALAH